jgi:opacity protein-like surface antigen
MTREVVFATSSCPLSGAGSSGARSSRVSRAGSSTISPPKGATAEGLKLAMRYHLIGLGRLVPYLEVTAGAGVREIDSAFTFVVEAGAGVSYFTTETVALNAGYRFQHISNGHTSDPNRGFSSDTGIGGVSFYFK